MDPNRPEGESPSSREASDPTGLSAARRCGQGHVILGTGPGDRSAQFGWRGLAARIELVEAVESEIPRPSSRETASPPHLGERPRERLAGNRLYDQPRKGKVVLSGPRRAQAGSHLPKSIGPRPEVGKRKTPKRVSARIGEQAI